MRANPKPKKTEKGDLLYTIYYIPKEIDYV